MTQVVEGTTVATSGKIEQVLDLVAGMTKLGGLQIV